MFMHRFYRFCIRFLQISSLILFGILAAASFLGTAAIEEPYDYVLHLKFDHPVLNLLFLLCYLGACFVLGELFSRTGRGNAALLILTCLWLTFASLLWTYSSKNGPIADGASVYYAAKRFAVGDFSAATYHGSYFSVYPFQYGLAFFYEMIFRLARSDNFRILQGVNALFLAVCAASQYHLCGLFFRDKKAQIYTLFFLATCAPFIMYGSFVYGEIPSITFSLFGTWMLFLFLDGSAGDAKPLSPARRALCGMLALFAIPAAVLVRKNSLIFIIALGITATLWLIRAKDWLPAKKLAFCAAYFALLFSLSVSVLPLVQRHYVARTGEQSNPGVPAASYLAMGLGETAVGPGFYDGSNFKTFTEDADYDTETAAEIAWKTYRERLSYFMDNPAYSLRFFIKKFCAEWIDTGWAVFPATYNTYGERFPLAESLFSGALHVPFRDYISNAQMALYIAAALCMFGIFRQKAEKNVSPLLFVFPLTAFGGALLFLVWETSGRYILPYAIFMFPYAGYGARMAVGWGREKIK